MSWRLVQVDATAASSFMDVRGAMTLLMANAASARPVHFLLCDITDDRSELAFLEPGAVGWVTEYTLLSIGNNFFMPLIRATQSWKWT